MTGEAEMPGDIERAFNLAARAMQRRFGASGTEEDIEAALSEFFAPILAEKEREITELKGRLAVRMDYLVGLATTADRHVEAAAEARALAAEAALAGERERCAKICECDAEHYEECETPPLGDGLVDYEYADKARYARELAAAIRAQGE